MTEPLRDAAGRLVVVVTDGYLADVPGEHGEPDPDAVAACRASEVTPSAEAPETGATYMYPTEPLRIPHQIGD